MVGSRGVVGRLLVVVNWVSFALIPAKTPLHFLHIYAIHVVDMDLLDISDETVLVVSVVGDNLGAAVREFHPVFTLDSSILVLGLSFGEVVAVVVDTSVLVGKGLWWSLFLEDGNKFENMAFLDFFSFCTILREKWPKMF